MPQARFTIGTGRIGVLSWAPPRIRFASLPLKPEPIAPDIDADALVSPSS